MDRRRKLYFKHVSYQVDLKGRPTTIRIAPAPSATGLAADLKTAKTEVVAVIPANSNLNPC